MKPEESRHRSTLVSFACFECRKSFKQPIVSPDHISLERHVCPECGREMTAMGRYFTSPRKDDLEQWKKTKALVDAGFRFFDESEVATYPERLRDVEAFIRESRERQLSRGEELLRKMERKKGNS